MFSLFSRTPKSRTLPGGGRVANRRKVEDVMGPAFDYLGNIGLDKAFAKKFMKFTAKEFACENIMFLLVVQKYVAAPTAALFQQIYTDFVADTAERTININSSQRGAIRTVKVALDATPTMLPASTVFDVAVFEIRKLVGKDTLRRLKGSEFDAAFIFTEDAHRREYEKQITFLSTAYGITLK